jgi:16S rRNA U516 pseudouridylate synthase RsuA-like enzyme
MFAKLGLKVNHLVRTAIGPLRMGEMPIGAALRLHPRDLAFAHARLKPGWKPVKRPTAT